MSDYAMKHGQKVVSLDNVSAAGIGHTYALPPPTTGVPVVVTWSYEITGGPPATIQVDLEGSLDGLVWYVLDTSVTVGSVMRHVANKPVIFLRQRLVSIGAGGGTVLGRIFID